MNYNNVFATKALNENYFFKGILKGFSRGINHIENNGKKLYALDAPTTSTYYPFTIKKLGALNKGGKKQKGIYLINPVLDFKVSLIEKYNKNISTIFPLETGYLSKNFYYKIKKKRVKEKKKETKKILKNKKFKIKKIKKKCYKVFLSKNNVYSKRYISVNFGRQLKKSKRVFLIKQFNRDKKISLTNKLFYMNLHENNGKFSLNFTHTYI